MVVTSIDHYTLVHLIPVPIGTVPHPDAFWTYRFLRGNVFNIYTQPNIAIFDAFGRTISKSFEKVFISKMFVDHFIASSQSQRVRK